MSANGYEMTPAAHLVEDLTLYPRGSIDDTHVADLAEAIRAGVTLPPLVAWRANGALADGVHRRRAHLRVNGAAVVVPVIWQDYPDAAAFFADAIRRNAGHGRRLSRVDQVRCLLRAEGVTLDRDAVCDALGITTARAGELLATRVAIGPDDTPTPLKRPFHHLAGARLTEEQVATQARALGISHRALCDNLLAALNRDMLDWNDGALVERLLRLSAAIDGAMRARAV
jgi:hypothetical protein